MMNIRKNRFLTWLIWLIPISLFGLPYAAIWTVIQLMMCSDQKKEYAKKNVPLWEREDVVELNKKKGIELTEYYNGRVYISDDFWVMQYPKKKKGVIK